MAVCVRTGLMWSVLRAAARGGALSSGVKHTLRNWRTHTCLTSSPFSVLSSHTWSSSHRALCTQAPYKDDEYPPLPDYTPHQETSMKEVFIIRVKGLPWSCSAEDLVKFFSECQIRGGVNGVHLMQDRNGRPNGQAFIELEHEKDVSKALERHRNYLGPRYIEVFEVTNNDAETILKSTVENPSNDGVVRLRGLPFNCTESEVIQFFSGLDIMKNGVTLVLDHRGRSTGEAFVQFETQEMANQALQKDREVIGHRYIEVFPSNISDIQARCSRGRGGVSGSTFRTPRINNVPLPTHYIHMRGLPFQATAADIVNFFYPIRLTKILIEYGPDGRPRGEAEAYFTTQQDAVEAMSKDKHSIQNRYIELFLNTASRGDDHRE